MDRDEMRRRFGAARVARLATVAADQRPHLVPVCFALLGDVVYSATDHKPKRGTALRRHANVRATGRAALLVDEYDDDWSALWWVRADGPARIATEPAEVDRAIRALTDRYPQYTGRPPHEPVLAVTVADWSGWSAAG